MTSAVIARQHATQSGLIHACMPMPSIDRRYDRLPCACFAVIEVQATNTGIDLAQSDQGWRQSIVDCSRKLKVEKCGFAAFLLAASETSSLLAGCDVRFSQVSAYWRRDARCYIMRLGFLGNRMLQVLGGNECDVDLVAMPTHGHCGFLVAALRQATRSRCPMKA
jgi:hypothetical protein